MADPAMIYQSAIKHLLCYLRSTKNIQIYHKLQTSNLIDYLDTDYERNKSDTKLQTD